MSSRQSPPGRRAVKANAARRGNGTPDRKTERLPFQQTLRFLRKLRSASSRGPGEEGGLGPPSSSVLQLLMGKVPFSSAGAAHSYRLQSGSRFRSFQPRVSCVQGLHVVVHRVASLSATHHTTGNGNSQGQGAELSNNSQFLPRALWGDWPIFV